MPSVNFRYPYCIGNTSAPLHLLLRSWLLKVDSKHWVCWLSACLYIRTQIVGRLTACCCQSNKSYLLWPHLPVSAVELWTVMSFIWAVSSAFPFTSSSPLLPSLNFRCFLSLSKGNPIPKPLVSRHNLLCHCFSFVLLWVFFTIIITMLAPFICKSIFPSLHNGYFLRVNTWVNTLM